MIALALTLLLQGPTTSAPKFHLVMAPVVTQSHLKSPKSRGVSAAFRNLPTIDESLSEIRIGSTKLDVVVPGTAAVDVVGYTGSGRPYLSVVSSAQGGAHSVYGIVPLVPLTKGYGTPNKLPKVDIAEITDVNLRGSAAFVLRSTFPLITDSFKSERLPEAKVYRDGRWINVGRALTLKINDRGDIAGITIEPNVKGEGVLKSFLTVNGKRTIISSAKNVLLTESGDVLSFSVVLEKRSENQYESVTQDAVWYSSGQKKAFPIKRGTVPVAAWSKDRFIVHDPEGTERFFLVENGKYTPLDRVSGIPEGRRLSRVMRVYGDGRIWVQVSDNEGTHYDAFLIPRK